MANGKTGFFELSGSKGFTVRVDWAETYDVSTNKSEVNITSIQVKSSLYVGVYYLNGSVSIDGAPAITMNSGSGTHNVSLVRVDTYATANGSMGSVSDIEHATDGSKSVSITLDIGGFNTSQSGGNGWKVSGTVSVPLTTIPRASGLSVSDGTLGVPLTLEVTKNADIFTHTITYTCGSASGTIATKSNDTSITWTPPISLAAQNTAGSVVSVVFTLQTYSGETTIGDPVPKTATMAIPESVKPSCVLSVSDAMGYSSRYGAYVKGLSRFGISVVPSTSYGAEIISYKITANGTVYTEPEFITDAIASTEHTTITATVTDSRNRTSEVQLKTVSIMDYSSPAVTALSAVRDDSDGTKVNVVFSASVTPLNNLNRATCFIYWRKTGAVDYSGSMIVYEDSKQYSVDDYAVTIDGLDITSSYDVEVVLEDNHIGKTRTAMVPTAFALMHFRADGTGMAFGKMSQTANAIELGLPMYDKFGALMGNGLSAYSGGGDNGIDPDTTLEELCLTSHSNAPQGTGTFYYIHTVFYNTKSVTAARAQIAFPYNKVGSAYHRYYASGAWSAWARYMTEDEMKKAVNTTDPWPVNSIYISYSHESPAELFGGTWYRIQSRFLWGTTTEGNIGATAGEMTHTLTESEMPSHKHNIAWNDANPQIVSLSGNKAGASTATASQQGYRTSYSVSTVWKDSYVALPTGGGAAHNNMPPYVNVAIWRRTA